MSKWGWPCGVMRTKCRTWSSLQSHCRKGLSTEVSQGTAVEIRQEDPKHRLASDLQS